jgi:hypothetical protein
MHAILLFLRRLWILIRRQKFEDELTEEMSFHHDQAAKEFAAQGMDSEAAQYAARRQFGTATPADIGVQVTNLNYGAGRRDLEICGNGYVADFDKTISRMLVDAQGHATLLAFG